MRIAEYKQIDTKRTEIIITVNDYDDEGNVIGQHEETIVKEVPVMGVVYRDMTPEEEAEMRKAEEEQKRQERETFLALPYGERVEKLIRERYTVSDELAILRQKDDKPDEYAEYFAFAEECKIKAKQS